MRIAELEAMTVVGLPVRAKWQELWTEVPAAWRALFARLGEIEHRQGERLVDVSLDMSGDEYLQLVCAPVSKVVHVPQGMWAVEIPAQRYVRFRHVGPAPDIADSFGRMYEWAEEHGHAAGEFKVDIGYTVQGDENEHDLHIGLLPPTPWRLIQG